MGRKHCSNMLLVLLILTISALLFSCGKKEASDSGAGQKISAVPTAVTEETEQAGRADGSENDTAGLTSIPSDSPSVEWTDQGVTPIPTAVPTQEGEAEDSKTAEADKGETGSPEDPEEYAAATAVPEEVPEADEAEALRSEAWTDSFLVWIPEYTDGSFTGITSDETFDYAHFTDTDEPEVRAYIARLEAAGFTVNIETDDSGDRVYFTADNSDAWTCSLEYEDGSLVIASGYRLPEEDDGGKIAELRTTTVLGLIPEFVGGSFESSELSADGSSCYIVVSGTDEEYIRSYIEELINAGYTSEADRGDSDGFIWYTAGAADDSVCDLTYYDGVVRVGCMK